MVRLFKILCWWATWFAGLELFHERLALTGPWLMAAGAFTYIIASVIADGGLR
jgi:hypothetical protein